MNLLPAILRDRALLGAGLSLTVKVVGSGTAVVMFALAARGMAVADFGLLVIVFNIVSFLAVLAVLGQETLVIRTWGEYSETEPELACGAVLWGISIATLGAVATATAFSVWAELVDRRLDGFAATAAALFVLTQTGVLFSSSLTRAVRGILWSEPHRELTWRLPIVVALAGCLLAGRAISIGEFFAVAAAGQIAVLVFQGRAVLAGLPDAVRRASPRSMPRIWGRLAITMTSAAIVEAANQYADVVLIGWLAGPAVSAGWFVAIRIANVFGMLTSGLHNYTASRVSTLYWAKRHDELQALLSRVMGLALALVVAVLALVVFGGPWFLSLFGPAYRDQYPLLLALSLITAFATLAGPGPLLMLTTGRERLYLRLISVALVLRIGCLVVLVPWFGLWGAVVAMAVAVIPPAIAITVVAVRSIGVDPSVIGVIVRIFSKSARSR